VKFGRRKIGEIVRSLPDKNKQVRLALQLSLAICGNSTQNLPGPAHGITPRVRQILSTFSGIVAERVNTAKTSRKV